MPQREPIFNAPGIVLLLVALFVAVHGLRIFLPVEQSDELTVALAFIPARFGPLAPQVPGGPWAAYTSLGTHVVVHGDLTHLLVNSGWLLAFGTPVARRLDIVRFLLFFLVCGVAGALFYLVINPDAQTLLIGASGAISGLMGGAFRFLFAAIRDGDSGALSGEDRRAPLMSLFATLLDRRALTAIALWTALNFVLAWGAAGITEAAGIAWEAHLGGFYAGLLLFGLFDRGPPPLPVKDERRDDAAPAG